MRVKITKLREADNPLHPNNIDTGYETVGNFIAVPKVGESFLISRGLGGYFCTSTVQEIIDDNTFRTHNSIYRYELI